MEKIKIYGGMNLDQAVELLLEYKKEGKSVYCEFNGHKLYSDNVTIDSAYMEVIGMTKTEFDKEQQEWLENHKKEEEQAKKIAIEKIPEWIEKGKKYIYPQNLYSWEECVIDRAEDIYHGEDLNVALQAIEALSNGESFENVNKLINEQNHSGSSHSTIMSIIVRFCKNGPEFYEAVDKNISEETKVFIEKQKMRNLRYEKELNNEREL